MKEKFYILLNGDDTAKMVQGDTLEQILIDTYCHCNYGLITGKMFTQIINSNALPTFEEKLDFYNVLVDNEDDMIYKLYETSNVEPVYRYC